MKHQTDNPPRRPGFDRLTPRRFLALARYLYSEPADFGIDATAWDAQTLANAFRRDTAVNIDPSKVEEVIRVVAPDV